MTHFILGLFAGLGIAFSLLAIWEVDERKKQSYFEQYEEWRRRRP